MSAKEILIGGMSQRALRRQGLSEATRDSYARALRRLQAQVEVPLDQLGVTHLKDYFSKLIESHSWSTVKVDRCGLQFFYLHVLERDWNRDPGHPPSRRATQDTHPLD